MQSELLPSAWPVEEPSNDQSGNSLGSKLVMGFWITFVLERISLNTTPCAAATEFATHMHLHLFSVCASCELQACYGFHIICMRLQMEALSESALPELQICSVKLDRRGLSIAHLGRVSLQAISPVAGSSRCQALSVKPMCGLRPCKSTLGGMRLSEGRHRRTRCTPPSEQSLPLSRKILYAPAQVKVPFCGQISHAKLRLATLAVCAPGWIPEHVLSGITYIRIAVVFCMHNSTHVNSAVGKCKHTEA